MECGWIQMFIDSSIQNLRNAINSALNNRRLCVLLMILHCKVGWARSKTVPQHVLIVYLKLYSRTIHARFFAIREWKKKWYGHHSKWNILIFIRRMRIIYRAHASVLPSIKENNRACNSDWYSIFQLMFFFSIIQFDRNSNRIGDPENVVESINFLELKERHFFLRLLFQKLIKSIKVG